MRTSNEWENDGYRSDAERVLRAQARQYATIPTDDQPNTETDVLLFQLGDEQFAVEIGLLRSVHPVSGITSVPCAPATVAGIMNVRGEIVSILDLRAAVGAGHIENQNQESRILLVDAPVGARVGLLVDRVVGVRRLSLTDLDRSWLHSDVAEGIAEARIVLINLPKLLALERFAPDDANADEIEARTFARSIS